LLLGVAGICMLLVVMVAIGMFWAMGLLMLVLLIGAHIVGNSLGTQLRDFGSQQADDTESPTGMALPAVHSLTRQKPLAGRMQEKRPVSWLLIALSAGGTIASGAVGGISISSLYWDQIGAGAIAIATLASGVIGGLAIFLLGSFIDMAQRVMREATTDIKQSNRE
jgi:hypothetical protein